MEHTTTIAVIVGTTRPDRKSIAAARYVAEQGKKLDGVHILFIDPANFSFPNDGSDPEGKDPRYTELVTQADAFFIVTPEYNHSIPGSLKRMLDSEYELYFHKPVALAGVSNGPWGGVRVCEALLPVCHRLGMINILPEVYFPNVNELFDGVGNIDSERSAMYEQNVRRSFDELLWFCEKVNLKGSDAK